MRLMVYFAKLGISHGLQPIPLLGKWCQSSLLLSFFSLPHSQVFIHSKTGACLHACCYRDLVLFISLWIGALSLNTTLPSFATYWYCQSGPINHAVATPPSKPPNCHYSSELVSNKFHGVTEWIMLKIRRLTWPQLSMPLERRPIPYQTDITFADGIKKIAKTKTEKRE